MDCTQPKGNESDRHGCAVIFIPIPLPANVIQTSCSMVPVNLPQLRASEQPRAGVLTIHVLDLGSHQLHGDNGPRTTSNRADTPCRDHASQDHCG